MRSPKAVAPPIPASAPFILIGVLLTAAAVLAVLRFSAQMPLRVWLNAIAHPEALDMRQVVFHYAALPRLVVAVLAGAALAFAGVIFQQVLRNPLAEPTTLGVSAGASLALTVATLWFPAFLDYGRDVLALTGAAVATAIVFALAYRRGFSALSLILGGMIVGMATGSINAVVTLFHFESLHSVFLWNTGVVRQNDWAGVLYLLPRVAAAMAVAAFLYRPLNILALEEESSKSLGLSLIRAKAGALAVAVSLSAFVVATVGMIGFIGLAAPALVRLAGARTLKERLVMAPLLGGGLLWLADELVQLAPLAQEIPTGIATAVLGAPLLMWMLPRLRNVSAAMWRSDISIAHRTTRPWRLVAVVVLLLALIAWPAFDLGRGPDGWRWWSIEEIARYGHWRLPRLGVATAAGIMLAIAGTLVQRLFGNPMASPEILGISSGAVLGVLLLLFIVPFPYLTMQIVAATAGAFLTLTGMLAIGKRSAFSPEHMLLLGIAISSTVGALGGIMMASNDPRFDDLFWWMSGSTNRSTGSSAMLALSVSGIALLVLPLFSRWLEILPLGETSSRALGVSLRASRFRILLFVAALTAGTTLILGPISFIGLMAPHLAKLMGLQRPLPQIYGAAAMGALLMVLADWLGRIVLYPDQIPAGLVASFVGSSYFVWLTWRRAG